MDDRERILEELLEMAINGDAAGAREQLKSHPELEPRFEELRATAERIERAEEERRAVLEAASSQTAPLAEERLEAWVRSHMGAASAPLDERLDEHFPWKPWLSAAAAVLFCIFALGRWAPTPGPTAPTYLGPGSSAMELWPRGVTAAWGTFRWEALPGEQESFRVIVYDALDPEFPIDESPLLGTNQWNVDTSVSTGWPERILWKLELIDDSGFLDEWSAEAWLSH